MSKVYNPLFSTGASGSLGDKSGGITYSTWMGIALAKTKITDNDSNTANQQQTRGYFQAAVTAYHAETGTVKTAWKTYAHTQGLQMSGFNLYVGKYVKFLKDNSGVPPTNTNTPPAMS